MPPTPIPDWITLLGYASQPVIFAGLFIWLFVKDKNEAKDREDWFRAANLEHAKAMTEMVAELRAIRNEIAFRLDAIERFHDK